MVVNRLIFSKLIPLLVKGTEKAAKVRRLRRAGLQFRAIGW